MTNYSRTTLRELKKRYLNILKKCLLANLVLFNFFNYAYGTTITSRFEHSEDEQIIYDEETIFADTRSGNGTYGGAVSNTGRGSILFNKSVTFTNNKGVNRGGAIYQTTGNITFNGEVIFYDNNASWSGGAIYQEYNKIIFNNIVKFSNNTASQGGAIRQRVESLTSTGVIDYAMIFNKNTIFTTNKSSV